VLPLGDGVGSDERELGSRALDVVRALDEPEGDVVQVLRVRASSEDEAVVRLLLLRLRLGPGVRRVSDQVGLAAVVEADRVQSTRAALPCWICPVSLSGISGMETLNFSLNSVFIWCLAIQSDRIAISVAKSASSMP